MMTQPRTHDAYTVGWVCALPKERAAATAILHDQHPNLPKPNNDPNAYTLGSISGHNIVIASLPMGKIGTNSAATVASHMVQTFPAIRFGLMVGIGGGIPPKVRLGDVVVSVPGDQHPGVVQWDMGKAEQGGTFHRTGSLNNPPTMLLAALAKLDTDRQLIGSKIPHYLKELQDRYPQLAAESLRSEILQDVLFKANYDHVVVQRSDNMDLDDEDEEDESDFEDTCQYCDTTQIVQRKRRDMRVHYGLIASGNQVIKDAQTRKQLSESLGKVLCVEMEAAGLMDNFPCLVIRGISDYADSHKNKAWQGHAAVVAAAFAKELLGYVEVNEVEQEVPVKTMLADISRITHSIHQDASESTLILHKNEDRHVIDWLSPHHYGAQQSDILKRWHPATGQWFLHSPKYRRWLEHKGRTLFCPGIPGAGKTIMASAIIHDIDTRFINTNTGLAYIYFTFSRQREQTTEHVLTSLLIQFLRQQNSLPRHVRDLAERRQKKGTRPTHDELMMALDRVCSAYDRVFVVMDALDECSTESQGRATILSDLSDIQAKTGINILTTARLQDDITRLFKRKSTTTLPIVAQDQDMLEMLQSELATADQETFDKEFAALLTSRVVETAAGMFLLAYLHLKALVALPTKGHILNALNTLKQGSDGLNAVYELAIKRIKSRGSEHEELARKIISWVVHARRLMSVEEIRHALAIQPGTTKIDLNYRPSTILITSICAGLVTVDKESDNVRLVHYTTQEYFEGDGKEWLWDAQERITNSCVTYLSYEAFDGYCSTDEDFEKRLVDYPFYTHASCEWAHHVGTGPVGHAVIEFLRDDRKVQASSQALFAYEDVHKWNRYSQAGPKNMNGVHLSSQLGVANAVKQLLVTHHAEARDSFQQTPLLLAAKNGHSEVVRLLLETENVDINTKDEQGCAPLLWAAKHGHSEVVKLLLQNDNVDFNTKDRYSWTPLLWAVEYAHLEVVQLLLLVKDVSIDIEYQYGWTLLSWAAMNGSLEVVQLLLQTKDIDINSKDEKHKRTPLLWAAMNGHLEVVQLLLQTENVNIDTEDQSGRTPLSWAAMNGCSEVVRLLLQTKDIDINSKDEKHKRTPLLWAAMNGHLEVVQLLLQTEKVNINTEDKTGRTPLSLAAMNGYSEVVQLLLPTEQIDVNTKDDHYSRTPLFWAVINNFADVVQLLLETNKVDANAQDSDGQTPLSWAVAKSNLQIVQLLLESKKVDIDIEDHYGRTRLHLAAAMGDLELVMLLLQRDQVEANAQDYYGRTPLSLAIANRHLQVVRLLLQRDEVEADTQDRYDQTSLLPAVANMDLEMVQLLLQSDKVDANKKNRFGLTPLFLAVASGHSEVVQLLLQSDKVDANAQDFNGLTPLHVAASRGYLEVVKLLLQAKNIITDVEDDCYGKTPLAFAAVKGHIEVVRLLL